MTTDEALLTLQLDGMERLAEAHDVLAAEVRRYQAMRCNTCKYSRWPGPGRMVCKLYRCMVTPDHGCLAREKRDA